MVKLATTPPAPRQELPLPAASNPRPMNITIYGWSTKCKSLSSMSQDRAISSEDIHRINVTDNHIMVA
jgi:hypothetical protein